MTHFNLKKSDLSIYNKSQSPWIKTEDNGKVDIGNKFGDNEKISLEKHAVVRFISEYIKNCNHELTFEEKNTILTNLSNI